jgi:putative tricarboxylic transport membrane protein
LVKSRISSLIFLSLFAAYGYLSWDIPLDIWAEESGFTARTFPQIVAAGGMLVACLHLVFATPVNLNLHDLRTQFRWLEPLLLVLTMAGYALLLVPLGFVFATALFLLTAMLILGEKRVLVVVSITLGVPLVFLGLMTLLGIHLETGVLADIVSWLHG